MDHIIWTISYGPAEHIIWSDPSRDTSCTSCSSRIPIFRFSNLTSKRNSLSRVATIRCTSRTFTAKSFYEMGITVLQKIQPHFFHKNDLCWRQSG